MNETKTDEKNAPSEKPGLLKRIVSKVDNAMKEKAEAKSQESSCCSGTDNKGNKCC